jgi:hypothetical protein
VNPAEDRAPPEGRGAFGGFVGPRTLVEQVRVGAPYLFDPRCPRAAELPPDPGGPPAELLAHPLGWWRTLFAAERLEAASAPTPAQITDYFALCLAAHWASAPSYVPTDVDAKIRRALWEDQIDGGERRRMVDLALATGAFDVRGFSARAVTLEDPGDEPTAVPQRSWLGGHDGEHCSVLAGALADASARADAGDGESAAAAAELEEALDAELRRSAQLFLDFARLPAGELGLLAAAAILSHNAGDVNQGLGLPGNRALRPALAERYGGLVQRDPARYGGAFALAGALYRELLSAEGHRHYPLRAATGLRSHPALLLPISPLLDPFGERVATFVGGGDGAQGDFRCRGFAPFGVAQRAEVVVALVDGIRRVPGQVGYQRALCGFERAHRGGFEDRELAGLLPGVVRKALAKGPLRKELDLPRRAFESALAKRARATVLRHPPRGGGLPGGADRVVFRAAP